MMEQASKRFFASDEFGRKDVMYHLDDPDVEAQSAIKAFQRQQFAAAAKGPLPTPPPEPVLELTAKIERKYVAAEIVESGIQSIAVPMSGETTSMKRFASQLQQLSKQAGFADAATELDAKLAEIAASSTGVKSFLMKARPYATPEYHAALVEACDAAEAETGGAVTFAPGSAGYKKFAEKVKSLAQAHKLPWQMLVGAKTRMAGADAATKDQIAKDYAAWLQSAQLADVKAEIAELQAEATRLLDAHLSKTSEQVRKEQETSMAALVRKLEVAKGSKWAAKYQEDLRYLDWFDAKVAADPVNGPRASA